MKFANVDKKQCQELEQEMAQTKDKKWYRRLMIIKLSGQGHQVKQLAQMFNLHANTVREYIGRYNEGGLTGAECVNRFGTTKPII